MNHCFQSLTGSFFSVSFSFPVCCFFLSFVPSLPFFFPLPTLCFSVFLLFLLSSQFCPLSVRLSLTSPGTRIRGDVFMIVSIFHGVVLSVVLQTILSPGEQGLGIFFFFCNSKQIQICRLFFFADGGGSGVSQDVCVHAGERVLHTCMHVRACAWVTVMDWGPALFVLTPTVDTHAVVCMSFSN